MSFIKNYARYCTYEEYKKTTVIEDFHDRLKQHSADKLIPEESLAKLKLLDEDIIIISRKDLDKIVTDIWGE